MNDHRIFFPYIGLAIAVVWTMYLLFLSLGKRFMHLKMFLPAVIFSCIILLSAYAYGTYQRNKVWHTDESLWKDVTEKSPKNARGLMNYGLALMAKGDYKGAEDYFTRAIKLWPYYPYLHINMGILKNAIGNTNEAEQYFKNAITYRADLPESYYYYADFLYKQKRVAEAINNIQKALQLSPAHLYARNLLMTVYFEQGEFDKLRNLIYETLKIFPDNAEAKYFLQAIQGKKSRLDMLIETTKNNPTPENYINLSLEYYNAGKYYECISACEEALKLNPDLDVAYNNICSAYNMLQQWDKAIKAGQKAVELNPANQLAKNNLQVAITGMEHSPLAKRKTAKK
jgi:tetratricopeptide (TPR) repeat protein